MHFQIDPNPSRAIGAALSGYINFNDDFEKMVRARFNNDGVRENGFCGDLAASERQLICAALKRQQKGVNGNSHLFDQFKTLIGLMEGGAA